MPKIKGFIPGTVNTTGKQLKKLKGLASVFDGFPRINFSIIIILILIRELIIENGMKYLLSTFEGHAV